GIPERLGTTEEREVHASRASYLQVGPLAARPVFVVSDRQIASMPLQVCCALAVHVDSAQVREVVAIGLQPTHHRILGVPHEAALAKPGDIRARIEWPVVADLERATATH